MGSWPHYLVSGSKARSPTWALAAEAAGLDPATPRQWRIRDEAYRYAEWRARKGEGPDLEIESAPPEPGRIKELLERHRRAVAVCNSMGPGPWNVKTRSAREWNEGAYQQNYDQAIETARDLKAAGITEGVTIPPPMRPYPPERRPRPRPLSDGYLWPISINPQLHAQRRSRP